MSVLIINRALLFSVYVGDPWFLETPILVPPHFSGGLCQVYADYQKKNLQESHRLSQSYAQLRGDYYSSCPKSTYPTCGLLHEGFGAPLFGVGPLV